MTIFFLISSMAKAHGVERTLADKMNYLADHGHDVTLITYEQGHHPYAFEISRFIKCLDLNCRYFTLYRFPFFRRLREERILRCRFKNALEKLIKEYCPDVLVLTTYEGHFMKEVMSLKDNVRIVVESHTAFTHDLKGGGLVRRIRNYFYLRTLKQCDLLIALTLGDANCWKFHIKNVICVPNPVSFYIDELNILPKVKGRIIAVGRYHSQKRFDRLISAFSLISNKYPDWFVDIYGEGPEKNKLQRLINNVGLQNRVHLVEPTYSIDKEYQRSEFFVLSSDYEGFGLVIVEAMACGIPPISTDCPFGPSEIIDDGVSGLLCKMDIKDLANKIEWMITHESERKEMGLKARQKMKNFKKDIVIKEWEQAYMSVLK